MIRLKMAVAASAVAGVLAGGLAMPPAASADTTQVVYAWGDNSFGRVGVDPDVTGHYVFSPVPVHGAAANVTQLSGGKGLGPVCPVAALGRHGVGLGRQLVPPAG